MKVRDALRIVKEQTIPSLRASGGVGHAEALDAVVLELEAFLANRENKCAHEGCPDAAAADIFWPGRPRTPMCQRHLDAARSVAEVMGFHLEFESRR